MCVITILFLSGIFPFPNFSVLALESAPSATHNQSSFPIFRRCDVQGPPAESGAHAVIDHFSPRVRRPQSNVDVSIELQQRPVQNITSAHSGPDIVEVPEIRDKQVRLASVFLQVRKVNDFLAGIICCPASCPSQP